MIEIEGVPPAKAIMIPTGYVPREDGSVGQLKAELGLPADAAVIGTVAQLRPQKALTVLIDALALLPEPGVQLALVGDGPSREELEAHAATVGVSDRVHFLGTRVDLGTIFAGLDVAAMSSDFEGLPLFAFECMAHGTPLVATRVGGLPDQIEDGVTGLLVPRRDPQALATALGELLGDPARRDRMAAAAEERLGRFTMEVIAERFAELYDFLLRAHRAR